MKGLRYVIALFHVALIARANIENNNPGIIIVIMSALVIIVNVIKSTIVIIVGQPALNTIIVIKMFDSSSFHLSVIELYSATSRAPRLLGAIFCSLPLSFPFFKFLSIFPTFLICTVLPCSLSLTPSTVCPAPPNMAPLPLHPRFRSYPRLLSILTFSVSFFCTYPPPNLPFMYCLALLSFSPCGVHSHVENSYERRSTVLQDKFHFC